MQRFVGFCLCVLLLLQGSAPAQSKRKREITPARLEKLIRAATQGSPVVRPQAAQRLIKLGPVAHKAVLDHVASSSDLFPVGPELLEAAAGLAIPGEPSLVELRALFWKRVAERDFPWRAALVSGLGRNSQPVERERFVTLLKDRMLAVRLAALKSFAGEKPENLLPILLSRMRAEVEGVGRRALARRAYEVGHGPALWLLHKDLARNDYFFDQPVGLVARLEASRFLKALLPEGPEFDAQVPVGSEAAVAQRAAWAAFIEPLAGPEWHTEMEDVQPSGQAILGLELRSCRRGEFFLRWTDTDQLWIGRGQPRCFELEPGTHKKLLEAARGAMTAMGDKHLVGQAGCDQESYHFRMPGSKRSSVYLITKGPQPVPDLRPFALTPLLVDLMATLEATEVAGEWVGELGEALVDLGGDYRRDKAKTD